MNVEISEPQTAYPVEGGAGSRDDWRRPLSLEEVRKKDMASNAEQLSQNL